MRILSIDTSTSICSVAILEDKNVISHLTIDDNKTHSQNLMPMIDNIFKSTNLDLNNIDLICCNKGPGSFTGIRIGIATVKGLADPMNITTVGVSSLKTLAYSIKENGLICSILDAKNDNVYFGLFSNENNKYTILEKYDALNINDVINILKKYESKITFVGDGIKPHYELLKSSFKDAMFSSENINAINVALAGLDKFNNNEDINNLSPLYLRKSQAERLLKK